MTALTARILRMPAVGERCFRFDPYTKLIRVNRLPFQHLGLKLIIQHALEPYFKHYPDGRVRDMRYQFQPCAYLFRPDISRIV